MKTLCNLTLVILGMTFLSSCCNYCRNGMITVLEPIQYSAFIERKGVTILHGEDTFPVDQSVLTSFEKELQKNLYEDNDVHPGQDIQISYRYVQLERNEVGVEVTYIDSEGVVLGRIHTEGRVSGGLWGGSSRLTATKSAGEVARYTREIIMKQEYEPSYRTVVPMIHS